LQICQEIVDRKPVFVDYIEKLVKLYEGNGDPDKARETIVKCIKINDCNIDLWSFYLNWTLEVDYIGRRDEDKTKEIFEEARSKIGTHPKAFKFWKKYAEFELIRDNKNLVNLIYYCAL
jgi:hypothetical protein